MDHQRGQEFNHLILRAGQFDDETATEALFGDGLGKIRAVDFQAPDQAATAHFESQVPMRGGDLQQARLNSRRFPGNFVFERFGGPEIKGGGGADEGEIIAAESAGMFRRFPEIDFGIDEDEGHGEPQAAERFGKHHDVRLETRLLKTEEAPASPIAHLDIVNDEEDIELAANSLQAPKPLGRGHIDASFGLNRFQDDRGWNIGATAFIGEEFSQMSEGIDIGTQIAFKRDEGDIEAGDEGFGTEMAIPRGGQGAGREPVVTVGESDDIGAAFDLASELEGSLDSIGAGRSGELNLIVQPARLKDQPVEFFQKIALGDGPHVQGVDDSISLEVVDDRLFDGGVVVTVIESAGAGEEIDELDTLFIKKGGAASAFKDGWKGAAVGSDFRFKTVKYVHME